MKNFIILGFVLGIGACSTESVQPKETTKTTKWELVKMTGSMTGSVTTGTSMAWQEDYTLVSDNTFVKRRIQGTEKIATGKYRIVKDGGQNYFELTFETGKELVGSCLGQSKELLWLVSAEKIVGTWNICDGPGLEYRYAGEPIH